MLENRIQNVDEPVVDYFYDKAGMCRSLDLTFSETRDYVLEGLRSQDQAYWTSSQHHKNLTELLSDLHDWMQLRDKRKTRFASNKNPSTGYQRKTPPEKDNASRSTNVLPPLPKWTTSVAAKDDAVKQTPKYEYKAPQCYNCRAEGHIARDCPKPRRPCSNCGSTRHTRSRCTATEEAAETTTGKSDACLVESLTTTSSRIPFLKTVQLNGKSVDGLVDTGASDVLVRASIARKCNISVRLVSRPLYTVGDATQPGAETTGEGTTDVAVDGVIGADHPVFIVPDKSIPVDVIVGRSWLDLAHVVYFKCGAELVFDSVGPADPSCAKDVQMDIVENSGTVPINAKPYHTSPTDRKRITEILQEWKSAGIVSDSTSPYASPVLLVNKASGDKRLCVDYRKLNQQTVAPVFPMPDIDGQLSTLADGVIFTRMDLSNGFLQIPLSPQAKEKTAFITEDAAAKFERMPFGLKGAPTMFQRMMNTIFKELKNDGLVNVYMDDIIMPSKDSEHMLDGLEQVFKVLRAAGLTLKPNKCTFGFDCLEYLGFRISKGTIQPGKKTEVIATFPRPRNEYEVRRFLGLTGYFRRFIVNYAKLAAPLTTLTGKNTVFTWEREQQKSFDELKRILCSEPVVAMYDPTAPITQVHTDASSVALSGVLLQGSTSSELHMVYAVSKKTTDVESRYHSSRLELYAIIWTLDRLRPFLLGIRFTIFTDCQPLVYLNVHKTTKPQVARWFEALQEFDFEIKYRPGSRMAHVDALSRVHDSEQGDVSSVETDLLKRLDVFVALSPTDRVRFMQQSDEKTKLLINLLQTDTKLTVAEKGLVRDYQLTDGVLYRLHEGRALLVVPESMRKGVVIGAHDYGGHHAVERTIAIITRDYWFAGLRRYVRQHVHMCLDCLIHKRPAGKKPGLLHPIPAGRRPFQVIHVDHLGPFETSTKSNKYLLVVADNLTKYIHLYPCRSTDTAGVIRSLTKFCNERGMPERIISDRGSCFTANAFQTFCQTRGIKHTLNSTRHPQANGQVERANRTITPILSMSAVNQQSWDARIGEIERFLNSAPNKTTTKTPFEALHGYQPRFHGGTLSSLSLTRNEWTKPDEMQQFIQGKIVDGQQRMKETYDLKRTVGIKFNVGEVVVMLRQPAPDQPSKLQGKYR
ncbi:hypothetical protein QTP88_021373 [Uroleucon formosanum]